MKTEPHCRQTPETDALVKRYRRDKDTTALAVALTMHAMRLERERDNVVAHYVESQTHLAVAERELARAREEIGRIRGAMV
jgi:hypothetical protein